MPLAAYLYFPRSPVSVFFFFQAEDGIRDLIVTGVQTCALPISVLEVQPEQLDRELAVNLKTAFLVSQAAIPLLLARGGGAIVNFASVAVLKPQQIGRASCRERV